MIWFWIFAGAALIALTFIWPLIQPLRRYFLMLTLIWAITKLLALLTTQNAIWLGWFGSDQPWVVSFFGERLAAVLLALVLAGILILLGQSRRDLFLVIGELNAPVEGLQRPGTNKPIRWTVLGPIVAVGLTTLFGMAILMLNPPKEVAFLKIIPFFPAILLFAAMNAFCEEFAYRAAPLSQLWTVVGKGQAIWMTAVWFGLGHYYGGIPSGPMGAVFLTLVAVLFGKAMLETKGIAMPVFIHLWGECLSLRVMLWLPKLLACSRWTTQYPFWKSSEWAGLTNINLMHTLGFVVTISSSYYQGNSHPRPILHL